MTSTHGAGDLVLHVELQPALAAWADVANPQHAAARESIEHGVHDLVETLGIPASTVVVIAASQALPSTEPIRVIVGQTRLRCPSALLQRIYSYVRDAPPDPLATTERIAEWLRGQCETGDATGRREAADFLAMACVELLKLEPALLFGPEQARAYAALLPQAADPAASEMTGDLDAVQLSQVLGQVLSLGISIADRRAVATVLAAPPGGRTTAAMVEDAIAALRPDAIEIRAPRAFLRELTASLAESKEADGVFPFLRQGLFEELGIELPKFRFVAVDHLKPRTFAITLNHLTSVPFRGLDPHQRLVNDTADRLTVMQVDATPTTNPATGQPASLVDAGREADLQSQGLTTWNPIGHVVLCVADRLRQDGHLVVHRAWVQNQLHRLEWVVPALVVAFRARWSADDLTGVLRGLVRERVSIRNWPVILERLVEWDVLRRNVSDRDVERPYALDHPEAFVRLGLRHEIAYQAARQTNTVVVYLLDPAIEKTVTEAVPLGARADAILQGCRDEFAHLPPTAQRPHILTVVEARRPLSELVRREFPRLLVIAHEELPPGTNVQPIARITATAS